MAKPRRTTRATRPTRHAGFGTTQARGATFVNLTRGTGISAISPLDRGPLGQQFAGRYAGYDSVTKGWIALALADKHIRPLVNFHNVGSGPELVVCGFFLAHHYVAGRDLYFQEYKIVIDDRTRTSRKLFIVDVAINSPFGTTIYLNIDGHYFHTRTELQEFHDALRNIGERRTGRPVDVPDTMCRYAATLTAFLGREGVP